MEATDLNSAVEKLIAPAQEETGEVNQVEVEEEVIEPDQDGDVIDDEDVDEYEMSDEGEDIDLEDVDLEEVETKPDLYDVKVDGEMREVTLDELKRDYSGQQAIQNRFQEAAQLKKQAEAEIQQAQQYQQQLMQMYQQAQQGIMAPPQAPSQELAQDDPIEYMQQRAKYEADVQVYQQQQAQYQALQQQQQQQTQEQERLFVEEQAKIIRDKIPELADPEKGQAHWQALMNVGREYGFSDAEIAATQDARYIEMANDAMKYRRILANRKKADAKSKKAKPVVKAGAKKVADPQGSAMRKQQQRLQKSGRIEDAIDLILKS